MIPSRIQLGRFKGIKLQIDPTWFIVFFLITFSLTRQFQIDYPHWSSVFLWMVGILASGLFFISVLIHEMAHSLVASAKGIPVRSITLFIFGGVAQVDREANRPWTEFWVAVAGPAASILLALLFGGLWWLAQSHNEIVSALAGLLSGLNLTLAVFNLIPGFPLDGGRILRSILWGISGNYNTATKTAATMGKVVAYLFILAGLTAAMFGNLINGLWIGFIGWFLLSAAQQGYAQAVLRNSLAGIPAREVMTPNCTRVPVNISLAQFVDDYLFHFGGHCFLAMQQDQLKGILTLNEINSIPRQSWNQITIGEAMIPLDRLRWVTPDQDVMRILESMDRENLNQVPVIEQGKLVGIIGRQEILHLLQTRLQAG
jgi:Zn-dependent protease